MNPNDSQYQDYINTIASLTTNNHRLQEIFTSIPEMSIENYRKTAFIYANKQYEQIVTKNKPIQHGFYAILENSIHTHGLLHTLRHFDTELKLIAETLNIDIIDLRNLLKCIRPNPNKAVDEKLKEQNARLQLREIIRKFSSIYKENYIKKIVADKMILLQATIIEEPETKITKALTIENFVDYIFNNPVILKRIRNIIFEAFCIEPPDNTLKEIIRETTKKSYRTNIKRTLHIIEPKEYKRYLAERHIKRLKLNFGPKLNEISSSFTQKDKELILTLINYTKKCYLLDVSSDDETFQETKMYIKKGHMKLIQKIAHLLIKANANIRLENNQFVFDFPPLAPELEMKECAIYHKKLKAINSVHNQLYTLYKKQNKLLLEFMETSKPTIPEEGTQIDKSKWLDTDKITRLISNIDTKALNKMSSKAYTALKKFLIKDGLLWTYLSDNISLEYIRKIINNFDSIYASVKLQDININNIQEIVKKANLYDYVDDFTIALIGIDNLSKIINYNQFLGVPLTDEIIRLRIEKVIDLAIRSEKKDTSSLPFTCDVTSQGYTLSRYHNNDPHIFTSGIDTKTCFCVGVNENDFFFYSLLSKDGYTVKISNPAGELVARASCFRKNNVLMINGIRYLNNKVIPENQEELSEFKTIIELIKLMAKKMITITSNDSCPIDYVVCNEAGMLENNIFENKFERINADLFKEPINVYNSEWEHFVHLYDNEPHQLLQEVPNNPNHSFQTDFGSHYPAILITSRNNMPLVSPRNISLNDQEDIYPRPRKPIMEYIGEEITSDIIATINRLRALDYHTKKSKTPTSYPFKLLTSNTNIKKVCIGDDWCIIIDNHNQNYPFFAKPSQVAYFEAQRHLETLRSTNEKDVKLFVTLKERLNK